MIYIGKTKCVSRQTCPMSNDTLSGSDVTSKNLKLKKRLLKMDGANNLVYYFNKVKLKDERVFAIYINIIIMNMYMDI